jgi:hypothetical protein
MNLQEREQLNLFLQQLMQVQASQKDAEADVLIREACARQPDAGYLLVQRAMQLEHTLQSVTAQRSQLQAELDKTRSDTQSRFLNDANAWGAAAVASTATSAPVAVALGSATQPPAQGPVPVPAPVAPAASSWGSGILGNVATTAAGVVAGSFLFQGIGNLMGHHNQSGVGGLNTGANAVPPVAENTAINNFFDDTGTDDTIDVADAGSDLGGDDIA